MTTVADVAAEAGRSPAAVLDACRSLGIVASDARSGLSSLEHERLREVLGADELPPVVRGSTSERPARTQGPPTGTVLAKRRLSPRTATRIGLAVFLVVAVLVSVASLRGGGEDVGACVELGEDGPTEVPCEGPHDAELVGVHELSGATFPGEAALLAAAEPPCRADFEARIDEGDRGHLELVLLVPTPGSWADGDRTVSCLVEDPDARLVGSIRTDQ